MWERLEEGEVDSDEYYLNTWVHLLKVCVGDYLIVQLEHGEDVSRKHWQGFVHYVGHAVRFSEMRKRVPGAHLEVARGSDEENKVYCSKVEGHDLGPFEYGSPIEGSQGKRSDLERVREMVLAGASMGEIFLKEYPTAVRYFGGISRSKLYLKQPAPLEEAPNVIVLYGPPGTGKTRWAWKTFGPATKMFVPLIAGGNVWYDGYDGQDVLFFDEFKGSDYKFGDLLKLCDWEPAVVSAKNAVFRINPRTIIEDRITAALHVMMDLWRYGFRFNSTSSF